MLLVAAGALFVTIFCCLVETALEVLIYQSFGQAIKELDTTGQGASEMRSWLVMTLGGNALIAMVLGFGVALLFRRNNVGRILIWSAGGVCVLVRLCCLTGVGMFGMVNEALQSEPDSGGLTSFAPSWQVWSAVATSSIALIAIVVAMIVIGLGPVNRYFRKRPVVPAAPGYPGPGPGQPYGGWGY